MKINEIKQMGDAEVKWLRDLGYTNTIHVSKGLINLASPIDINSKFLKKLKYPFGTTKEFNVNFNKLTTFENFPKLVKGELSFTENEMTSFEGISEVMGDISANNNKITTFKGLPPLEVNRNLMVRDNKLTSFEHCPKKILGAFSVSANHISSFEGAPEWIGSNAYFSNMDKLKSLKDIHKHIKHIGGFINLNGTPIQSHILGVLLIDGLTRISADGDYDDKFIRAVHIINRFLKKGGGKAGMLDCQNELMDKDLEDFAQL